jgi:orotidine-5'-phosphate decarboxylase
MVHTLGETVDFYKVGLELFISEGHRILPALSDMGKKIFLDLKIHDIPNTAKHAVLSAASYGVDMIDVHVQGGLEMMSQTAEALREDAARRNVKKPILLGVTLLTSLDGDHLRHFRVGVDKPQDYVLQLTLLAQRAGLDGVVASPNETTIIKKATDGKFITVTPGIRLEGDNVGDQKRVMTPQAARETGTDYIVVGRPITKAADPLAVANIINGQLQG